MKYQKLIRKWARLRHPDDKFAKVAIQLYESLNSTDQQKMLQEFQEYIDGVRSGIIKPSIPKIPVRVFRVK